MPPRTRFFAAACLLQLVVTVLLYWPGLSGGVYFDDLHVVVDNWRIRIDSLDWAGLISAANSFTVGGRQVSMLSFALNHYFFGDSVFAYKAVNLALHAGVGLLLLLFTRLLVQRLAETTPAARLPQTAGGRLLLIGLPAAFWLVQPMHVNSVLYISQRMAILAMLFMALGMCAYLYWRPRRLGLALGAALLCGAAAFYSKQNGLLLAPLVLLLEIFLFRFGRRGGLALSRRWLGWLAGAGAGILAAALVFPGLFNDYLNYGYREFSVDERVLTQFRALVFYLGQLVTPHAGALSMWHDDWALSTGLLSPPATLFAVLGLGGLLAGGLVLAPKWPLAAFGLAWFLVGHSLESTLLPLELVHEHRNYLPGFGIALALTAVVLALPLRFHWRAATLGVLLALNGAVLLSRATLWGDDFSKAYYEADRQPDSVRALIALNRQYTLAIYGGNEAAREKAVEVAERIDQLSTREIVGEVSLIVLHAEADRPIPAGVVADAARKIGLYPYLATNKNTMRGLLQHMQETEPNEQLIKAAEPLFVTAAESEPHYYLSLAGLYVDTFLKDPERTFAYLLRAEQLDNPYHQHHKINLAYFLLRHGQLAAACERYHEVAANPVREPPLQPGRLDRLAQDCAEVADE